MINKKDIIFVIYYFLVISVGSAQDRDGIFHVKGRAIALDSSKIIGGNVVLESHVDKKLRYITKLDSVGSFKILNVVTGVYKLKITSFGYQTYLEDNIIIFNNDITLGRIVLKDSIVMLNEVNIQAERNPVRSENGKLIIDGAGKIYKTSSNALDLISKLPSTTVNQESIKINGTIEPVVLIDGKGAPMTIQELKNLQAKEIMQIEMITNPGSEYEGNYNAVINIKLNKLKTPVDSFSANSYLGYGRNRYNQIYAGFGLTSQRKTKYIQFDYDYSMYKGYLDFENTRKSGTSESESNYNEYSFSKQTPRSHSVRLNYENSFSDKSKFGIDFRGNIGNYNELTYSNSVLSSSLPLSANQQMTGTNNLKSNNNSLLGTMSYQLDLGDNHEIESKIDYGYFEQSQNQQFGLFHQGVTKRVSTINSLRSYINLLTLNSDLKYNLFNGFKFLAGIKGSTISTNNNNRYGTLNNDNIYAQDSSRSNRFLYNERIGAIYGSLEKDIKIFTINVGSRYEYTIGTSKSVSSNENYIKRYGTWLPSVTLSRAFVNKLLNINLSYSKRLQRPSYADLNPFSIISSAFTRIEGNPYLAPAIFNNYELNLNYKDFNLSFSYRDREKLISQMPFYDSATKVLTLKMENIDKRASLAYSANYSKKITNWYSFQFSGTILYDNFDTHFNNKPYNLNGFNYTVNSASAFNLTQSLLFTINAYYTSSSVYGLYRFKPQSKITLGIRKELLDKKIVLVAEYRDIFSKNRDILVQDTDGFRNAIKQLRNSRTFDIRVEFDLQGIKKSIKSFNFQKSEEESRVKLSN